MRLDPIPYKLGRWIPDANPIGNPGLTKAYRVVPRDGGGYEPFHQWVDAGIGTLDAYARRSASGRRSNGDTYTVAGTSAKLWLAIAGALVDKTPAITPLSEDETWSFAQFGNLLLASSYQNELLSIDLDSPPATFTAIASGNAPKARTMAVVRDFVALGDTIGGNLGSVPTNGPERVWWGAQGNAALWEQLGSDAALNVLSDYQDLRGDFGHVRRIIGGADYGVVFQENGIQRMDFIGGDNVFQFSPVEPDRGLLARGLAIRVGRQIIYCSKQGWMVFDGTISRPIGAGVVDNFFFDDIDLTRAHRATMAHDPRRGVVACLYPGDGSQTGTLNRILFIKFDTWEFSFLDIAAFETLVESMPFGVSLDTYTAAGVMDSGALSAVSLDSLVGFTRQILGAFDSNHKFGTFTGDAYIGEIETGDLPLFGMVTGARPIHEGATLVGEVASRNLASEAPRYRGQRVVGSSGVMNMRSHGRYHRFHFYTLNDFESFVGFEIDASSSGGRR